MAIDAFGNNLANPLTAEYLEKAKEKNPNILGKDDFLKLLLLELKYQDPTAPMDSDKILTQTSQLAAMEAAENTNKALENLAASLTASLQFSGIGAIGKLADTGSNAVIKEDGEDVDFELYFPEDASNITINVLNNSGAILRSMSVDDASSGVSAYNWDGKNGSGVELDKGVYYIEASYYKPDGTKDTSRVGIYPIESVRFENGTTYVKLGSNYVDFNSVVEVTGI